MATAPELLRMAKALAVEIDDRLSLLGDPENADRVLELENSIAARLAKIRGLDYVLVASQKEALDVADVRVRFALNIPAEVPWDRDTFKQKLIVTKLEQGGFHVSLRGKGNKRNRKGV